MYFKAKIIVYLQAKSNGLLEVTILISGEHRKKYVQFGHFCAKTPDFAILRSYKYAQLCRNARPAYSIYNRNITSLINRLVTRHKGIEQRPAGGNDPHQRRHRKKSVQFCYFCAKDVRFLPFYARINNT